MHLEFRTEIIPTLFQKYRGATAPEAIPVRPVRFLPPDPTGRFSGRYFPDLNPLTGTRKHARKRCVVYTENKHRSDTKYNTVTVMLLSVRHSVPSFITHRQGQ